MLNVTKSILEGKSIRAALIEEPYSNDSFGYSLLTTLQMLLGYPESSKFNDEIGEGVYEFHYDDVFPDFGRIVNKISKKFPGYSFTFDEIGKDWGVIYVLKVKRESVSESAEFIPFNVLSEIFTENFDCQVLSSASKWLCEGSFSVSSKEPIAIDQVNRLIREAGYGQVLHGTFDQECVYEFTGKSVLQEDDKEYWNYVHTYEYGVPGCQDEVEKAADYFDVSPSAFEEDYDSFFETDEREADWEEWDEMDEAAEPDKDAVKAALAKLDAKCGALKAQDVFENTAKFQALVKALKESYALVGSFLIRVTFENRADESNCYWVSLDNSGGEVMDITRWHGGGGKVAKKVSATRWKTACSVFKEIVDQWGQENGTDKKLIFTTIAYNIDFQYRTPHRFEQHMENPFYQEASAVQSLEQALKALETDDYQGRNGDYPKAGVPDAIDVYNNDVTFSFKNTSESSAQRWVERYLKNHGFKVGRISAYQTGDYQDDWVDVSAHVDGFLNESKSLTEARFFKGGIK